MSSSVYTTEVITKIFKEEGGKLFDSRSASLGHTLQGGIPSPIDRARAVRLSLKCMTFIEQQHAILQKQASGAKTKQAAGDSAAVITIQGSTVKWVPVLDVLPHADMENRRGKEEHWRPVVGLVESLVARAQILEKAGSHQA